MFAKQFKISILLSLVLTIGTGLLYPLAITAIGQVLFPSAANGSLIYGKDGKPLGSRLIGQPFDDPKYFWSRPSATASGSHTMQRLRQAQILVPRMRLF